MTIAEEGEAKKASELAVPYTPPDQVADAIEAFSSMANGSTDEAKNIPDRLYFRIGDVADLVGVKPYVLRYWETEFPMIAPQKSASGQRVYRRSDVETVLMIKHLLYEERYSIDGARKRLRELRRDGGLKAFKKETAAVARGETPKRELRRELVLEMITLAKELRELAEAGV
jgi:DNA-binding transcriptional MerR regulator